MNIANFKALLDILPYSGHCLSPQESLLIENSLIILQDEQKFDEIYFWGKIIGLEADYYIAFGYKKDCLKFRRFFYSQNGFDWMLIPNPKQEFFKACLMCDKMFQGDPGLVLDIEMQPTFKMKNYQTIQLSGEIVQLKEENRLSCVVKMISDETMLVPRGAIYMKTDENIVFNPLFHGLKHDEASLLSNYQLYREPKYKFNHNLLKRSVYNYSTDFLDTVDTFVPVNKSFSITMERDDELILFKSLHWMGAVAMHEIGKSVFAYSYFGDGKKNHDVLFMV